MIELLDFILPTTDTVGFTVPVSAQPDAIILRTAYRETAAEISTNILGGNIESWGAVGSDLSQFAMGFWMNFYTTGASPRRVANSANCLRLVNSDATSEFTVVCKNLSPTEITFDCSGSLLNYLTGVQVYGMAISGLQYARAELQPASSWPVNFTSAPSDPQLAWVSGIGAPTSGVHTNLNTTGIRCDGWMNGTTQYSHTNYTANPKFERTYATNTAVFSFFDRLVDTAFRGRYIGTFTGTGLTLTPETTGVDRDYSIGALMLGGVQSKIENILLPATASSTNLSFTFAPEGMIANGFTNTLLDTVQDVPDAWGLSSRLFLTPGVPPGFKNLVAGNSSNATFNVTHRQHLNSNHVAGSEGVGNAGSYVYRGDVSAFDAQAAQIDWTLDGTGDPGTSRYWSYVALSEAEPPSPPIGGGGYSPFGPGVFR